LTELRNGYVIKFGKHPRTKRFVPFKTKFSLGFAWKTACSFF